MRWAGTVGVLFPGGWAPGGPLDPVPVYSFVVPPWRVLAQVVLGMLPVVTSQQSAMWSSTIPTACHME